MISFGLIAFAGSNTQERLLHESNIESVQGGHGVTMVVPRQVEDTSNAPSSLSFANVDNAHDGLRLVCSIRTHTQHLGISPGA